MVVVVACLCICPDAYVGGFAAPLLYPFHQPAGVVASGHRLYQFSPVYSPYFGCGFHYGPGQIGVAACAYGLTALPGGQFYIVHLGSAVQDPHDCPVYVESGIFSRAPCLYLHVSVRGDDVPAAACVENTDVGPDKAVGRRRNAVDAERGGGGGQKGIPSFLRFGACMGTDTFVVSIDLCRVQKPVSPSEDCPGRIAESEVQRQEIVGVID